MISSPWELIIHSGQPPKYEPAQTKCISPQFHSQFASSIRPWTGHEGQNMKAFEAGRRVGFFQILKGWRGCVRHYERSPPYLDFVSLIKSEGRITGHWQLCIR